MIQLYPTKAFYKVISEDDSVTEIDYISADEEGNLFIEKHLKNGSVKLYIFAVPGINCDKPLAPAGDTAFGLNRDSIQHMPIKNLESIQEYCAAYF